MDLYFKKHANYIINNSDLIVLLDLFCFSNDSDLKNQLQTTLCASKAISESIHTPSLFEVSYKDTYKNYIEYIKDYIVDNFNVVNINNNTLTIKDCNIEDLNKKLLNLKPLDLDNNTFNLILHNKIDSKVYLEITIDSKKIFCAKHRGFKRILPLNNYNNLTNIFNVSLLINKNKKSTNSCRSFYIKNESVFDLYFKYLNKIMRS